MNIAVADFAVEFLVLEYGSAFLVQASTQMTIGGVRRSIRQQHAGKAIQIPQAVTGEFKLQVQPAEVHRVGQRTCYHYPG
ncbi:hypothetical protein D3C71_1349440 [compost metagenome]